MLRQYQEKAIEGLRQALRAGKKKIVMALPTGGGKSHIFGQVISNCLDNGKTVLWLVHRRNLVNQMANVLEEHFEINPGIIMAGIESHTLKPVQLCTIQTYARRIKLDALENNRFYIPADVVLIDEAHRSISKSYREIIDLYQDKIIMGCTATPMRADQRGLCEVYGTIVDVVGVKELTENGHLAPARYFAPSTPNLKGVKVQMGDYVVSDLDKKVNTVKLNGDVVENWLKSAENRKTIVYAVKVKHSIALKDEFIRRGVSAEHLDARSSDEERQEVFDRMEMGDTKVICNVALYQEGLDVPDVSCIVMARPTKSMGLWRQCGGRGLRPSPGKEDCLIFDHGGVIEQNGFLEDEIDWTLDGKELAWSKPKKKEKGDPRPLKCTVCHEIFTEGDTCPRCGSPVKRFGKKITTTNDELKEIKARKATSAEKRIWFGMFKWQCREKGYKPGWASWKFKERFGVWPNHYRDVECIESSQEFKNWITYQNIKSAKSRLRTPRRLWGLGAK